MFLLDQDDVSGGERDTPPEPCPDSAEAVHLAADAGAVGGAHRRCERCQPPSEHLLDRRVEPDDEVA
ncbi:hypothetical protein C3E78_00700 [Aeromicrobium chenweiae]|uniref:Uncharacterized protein n=1 Tax=Aeromicrobium chenweiae TaxID=2079793 RepID=A0A2S0WHN4_9ACTN|nr:hypothetical protein C3E78_00700 [Aeromicrobium chenweiae]